MPEVICIHPRMWLMIIGVPSVDDTYARAKTKSKRGFKNELTKEAI